MTPTQILMRAAELVGHYRARTHGDFRLNHERIADLWTCYLSGKVGVPVELRPTDVALLMSLLKIARTLSGEHNPDNYTDGAGYLAIAGSLADEEEEDRLEFALPPSSLLASEHGEEQ